jgi:conjugative transfer ATPase
MSFLQDIKDIFVPPSKSNGGGKAPGKDSATKTAPPRDPNKLRNPREVSYRYSPVTEQMINNHYKRRPFSFADQLSITEYLEGSGTFLLDDCFSQAVVMSVSPIATEGRSKEQISELRDSLQQAFAQSFGANSRDTDWVLQIYSWKDDDLYRYIDEIYDSIHPEVRDTEFTQNFLDVLEDHFRGVNKPAGLFEDKAVTRKPWRGQLRRTYCVMYRRCSAREIAEMSLDPIAEANEVADRFAHLLAPTGVNCRRLDGEAVFRWLTDWFNPNPALTDGDREKLFRAVGYPRRKEQKPFGFNLQESVLFSEPISDPDNYCWWFDDMPHTFLRYGKLNSAPEIGQLTGEVTAGSGKNIRSSCLMDSVPAGAMLVQTIVFVPPTKIDSHLQTLSSAEKGETQEAARAQEALEEVAFQRSQNQAVYYASQGVFVRGKDLNELRERCQKLKNELLSNNVHVMDFKRDPLCVEAYPLHLPGCFEPERDKKRQYLQLYYGQHLANMCPIFGREQGTGNPGFIGWNRGGEPLSFDMFGADRVRAAHGVVLGPQGSGKSATLNYIAASVMAYHRPRLFILDKGGSFELLAEYFKQYNLTVNIMRINKNARFSLCPFLDAGKVAMDMQYNATRAAQAQAANAPQDDDDDDDAERDPLAEMEQSLYIMVTGGNLEAYRNLTATDKGNMRKAIILAGTTTYAENRKTITSDIIDAMNALIKHDARIDEEQGRRLREFASALEMYCGGGLDTQMFNTEGEDWPDADVTILDVNTYGSDKYPAQLALAYIGYMQRVINMAEKTQKDRRDVVNIIDEAHLFTANPLLGYQIAFAIKVARKIGLWMLLASQNVEDFSKGDDIKKILGLLEWWFLLNMEYKEVEDLCKYRNLTDEQKTMVLSCTKLKGCYTEAVVMGNPKKIGEMMVRQVPPSLFLALAMTESSEKSHRSTLMNQYGLTNEFEAALMVAKTMDRERGIIAYERDPNAPTRKQRREAMVA